MTKYLYFLASLLFYANHISAQQLPPNSSTPILIQTKGNKKQKPSQTKRTYILWQSAERSDSTSSKLKVSTIIKTVETIPSDKVSVLLNGKQVKSKADVVKFKAVAKSQQQFIYENEIELIEGINKVEVAVEQSDGSLKKSYAKILQKEGAEIRNITPKISEGGKGIYWQSPAWSSEPLVAEDRVFELKVLLQSPVTLQLSDIYLLRQGLHKIMPAADAQLIKLEEGKYEFKTKISLLEEGLNEVVVKVQSKLAGELNSEPLLLNFTPYLPNLHLISFGTQTNLDYTMKDAEDFAACFVKQASTAGGRLFNTIQTELLIGEAASAKAMKASVERLKARYQTGAIGEKDLILLYISSHGFLDEKRQLRIQGEDYSPAAPRATSVSYERDIVEILEAIPCKKLIFIDACYSGGSKNGNADVDYKLEELNRRLKGFTTIVSSKGDEFSYEDAAWQNGAFTEAILEGLLQKRANQNDDPFITIEELWAYLQARVPELVNKTKQKQQHPSLKRNDLGDLAIYYVN